MQVTSYLIKYLRDMCWCCKYNASLFPHARCVINKHNPAQNIKHACDNIFYAEVMCDPLQLENSETLSHINLTSGSVATVKCKDGYHNEELDSPDFTVVCSSDGTWNVTSECSGRPF